MFWGDVQRFISNVFQCQVQCCQTHAGRRRTGHLWQDRYFSCPVAAEKEEIVLGYTEWNPVRAAMVDKPEEYKWSSAAAHLVGPGAERIHLLDWTYWSNLGGAEEWK